jgi:hypothetical protein
MVTVTRKFSQYDTDRTKLQALVSAAGGAGLWVVDQEAEDTIRAAAKHLPHPGNNGSSFDTPAWAAEFPALIHRHSRGELLLAPMRLGAGWSVQLAPQHMGIARFLLTLAKSGVAAGVLGATAVFHDAQLAANAALVQAQDSDHVHALTGLFWRPGEAIY